MPLLLLLLLLPLPSSQHTVRKVPHRAVPSDTTPQSASATSSMSAEGNDRARDKQPCVDARKPETFKSVMLLGMSGAGKSNLANKLLDHPTTYAFEEGDGSGIAVTKHPRRARWRDMVVIDTPGMPDRERHLSLQNFDSVVETIRREESLSALIFVVRQESASPSEFGEFAVLLRQFNNLHCSKLMVCRQSAPRRRDKHAEEDRRHRGTRFVRQTLENSGLNMPFVLLTSGYGVESDMQVDEIEAFVRRSNPVPVNDSSSLRTSSELRIFLSGLAEPTSRPAALQQEAEELEVSVWHRSLSMYANVVPTAYVRVASHGGGFLSTDSYVRRENEILTQLRAKLLGQKEELRSGEANEEELNRARKTLEDLDSLLS